MNSNICQREDLNFITLLAQSIAHSIENIKLQKKFSEENEELPNPPPL